MFDCSKEFNNFYRNEVVLPEKEQNELREKRKLNIKRLSSGLKEYNEENNKNYRIAENRIQGSMAMHTTVQNDKKDYDIDVGVVFEADAVGELGARATRNVIANVLKRKTSQFAEEPDVKTSCVRLKYTSKGYHVDFAIFKRHKDDLTANYVYEHAGSDWNIRHLKALEEWFNDEIKLKGDDLRKIIRLSKMFCKSRETWKNMPSGFVQTVLCDERLATDYSRLDEKFYYTMRAIAERISENAEVAAPVDNGRALVTREVDFQRMNNWKSRLEVNLKELDVLFDSSCTYYKAIKAWSNFFNHSYWSDLEKSIANESFSLCKSIDYDDTEEFIEDKYPVFEQYEVSIDCKVSGNGFSLMPISEYMEKYAPILKKFIPYHFSVECSIKDTNCPSYDLVLWKVRNVGAEAERRNDIRGQILNRGKAIKENTLFYGEHYIECYLIKENICVAIGHVDVPIGMS